MGAYVREKIRNHKICSQIMYGKIDKIDWETDEVAKKARRYFDYMPDYSATQDKQ